MKKTVVLFCLVFIVMGAFAQVNKTWSGPNGGAWSNAAYWTPAGVPTGFDTVIINTPANSCDLDVDCFIAALRATGGGGSIINSSGTYKTMILGTNPTTSVPNALYVAQSATLSIGNGGFGITFSTYSPGAVNTATVEGTLQLSYASNWLVGNGGAQTSIVDILGTIMPVTVHTGPVFSNGTNATVRFLNGSILDWDRNGGSIPAADYQNGSTINVHQVTNTMPSFSANANYNGLIIWNNSSQTVSGSAAVLLPTASYAMDSVRVVSTGSGSLRIATEPNYYTLGHVEVQGGILELSSPLVALSVGTITKDLKISGGTVYGNATFAGDGPSGGPSSISVLGDLIMTGGTLNLTNRVVSTGGSGQINVAGNVSQTGGTITATTSFGSQNQFVLNGALAQNLTMSTFSGPMAFVLANSSTTGVTLLSNFIVPAAPASFVFASGVLNTSAANLLTFSAGAQSLFASNFSYVDGPVKKIGNTAFTFPIGKTLPPSITAYVPLSISAPALVTDAYTAEYKRSSAQALSTNYAAGLDHVSAVDYWILDRTNGTSPVNVTLNWTVQSSANGSALYINDISKLRIAHFNSGIPQWDTYGVSSTTGGFAAGSITLNSVNVFSPFSLASVDASNPLPVNLNYLNGAKQGNANYLNWKVTCTNNPSATMILEHGTDGRNFTAINTVTATALRCQQPFDYTDNYAASGLNYYRLKMVDANGKATYSAIIAILNKETGFDIVSLMPNIITNNAILNVTTAQKTKMDVLVTDITGRQVQKITYNLIAGSNQFTIDLSKLGAGMYQITGYTADGVSKTIRFVKQ